MSDEFKVVEVVWLDAGLESLQLSVGEAQGLTSMERRNVGYCIVNDEQKVILVFGFIEDRDRHGEACDQTLVIPRGLIKSVRELEEK